MSCLPTQIPEGMKLVKAEIGDNFAIVPENAEVTVKGRHIIYCTDTPEEKQKNRKDLEKVLTNLLGREVKIINS